MQRPTIQALARRYQIATELAKYGVHLERRRERALVTVDGTARLRTDGRNAWLAQARSARSHGGDRS